MAHPAPDAVAKSFVKQYYDLLTKNPSQLHLFYKEPSSFAHASAGQEALESCIGIDAIRSKIASLNLLGSQVNYADGFLDAQISENGAVTILVSGFFKCPADNKEVPFVQSFMLARQEQDGPDGQQKKAYYVRNSIFRLPKIESAAKAVKSPMVHTGVATAKAETASVGSDGAAHVVEATEVDDKKRAAAANSSASATAITSDSDQIVAASESSVSACSITVDVPDSSSSESTSSSATPLCVGETPSATDSPPVSREKGKPRSFADMVKDWDASGSAGAPPRRAGAEGGPGSIPARLSARKNPALEALAATRHAAMSPVVPLAEPLGGNSPAERVAKSGISAAALARKSAYTSSDPSPSRPPMAMETSVYVQHVPAAAGVRELMDAFASFGTVTRVDLHNERAFAFVNFESAEIAQAAIAGETRCQGIKLHVEGRDRKGETGGTGSGGKTHGGANRRRNPASGASSSSSSSSSESSPTPSGHRRSNLTREN